MTNHQILHSTTTITGLICNVYRDYHQPHLVNLVMIDINCDIYRRAESIRIKDALDMISDQICAELTECEYLDNAAEARAQFSHLDA